MSSPDADGRPLERVRVDEESRWFWEACRRHELILQRCAACETVRFHPRALCPSCLSAEVAWLRASGRGEIYTFTVTHQNQSPAWRARLPYVLAWIQLDEGPLVLSNVVGAAPEALRIGAAVEVVFDEAADGLAVPRFRLCEAK